MEKSVHTLHRSRMRKMTIVGMLSAVCIVLGLTGYGFVPLPTCKATILHVPVIIGAIVEGPLVGMMIGFIFGLFSIVQNMAAPSLLSFAFINPLVSVAPRMLIAITTYYAYRMVVTNRSILKISVGAAVGSLTNTFGVLGMIYFLYAAEFAAARSIDPATVWQVVMGVGVMNGIPEAILSVLITVPVVVAVRRNKGV